MITPLLQRVFDEAQKLSPTQQDDFAEFVLELLLEEAEWTALFAKSSDMLERLANEALDDHAKGETFLLDIDDL
ncbi:MAG: hypothetical protein SFZ02_02930 [bacterium]|nr:hypothetical protein [bacterium]